MEDSKVILLLVVNQDASIIIDEIMLIFQQYKQREKGTFQQDKQREKGNHTKE